MKTNFLQAQPPSEVIYSQIPTRKRPVYYSVYCVYTNFKHLLAGISEYFTVFSGNFLFETGLLRIIVFRFALLTKNFYRKSTMPNEN